MLDEVADRDGLPTPNPRCRHRRLAPGHSILTACPERETPGSLAISRFVNPANVAAREVETGAVILARQDHRTDALAGDTGAGGPIFGAARIIRRHGHAVVTANSGPMA